MSQEIEVNFQKYRFVEISPSAADYCRLRAAVGWSELSLEAAERGLNGSLFALCLYHEEELVGCGRIVGDGGIYFYLQDVIVLPAHQGRGLGDRIMQRLMTFLVQHAQQNSFIGLMAAVGAEPFYERYGFRQRPSDRPGMFLIWEGDQGGR